MKHLDKPNFSTKEIIEKCAESVRDLDLKSRLISCSQFIDNSSNEYDQLGLTLSLNTITPHNDVNGILSCEEMKKLYTNTFVRQPEIRDLYYSKILRTPNNKCPICGIGHISNLDHYLPKTNYPTYTVTPYNLVPICRDCNTSKLSKTSSIMLLHPYYEDIDDLIWLKANLKIENGGIIVEYAISEELNCTDTNDLYHRLICQMQIYNLFYSYSIEAANLISNKLYLWKNMIIEVGKEELKKHLRDELNSCRKVQNNTYETALYRALLEDIDIFDGIAIDQ